MYPTGRYLVITFPILNIKLNNCQYNNIFNNTFYRNTYTVVGSANGFGIYKSSYNNITENKFTGNHIWSSFELKNSHHNRLVKNHMAYESNNGLYMINSDNNTLLENVFRHFGVYSIYLINSQNNRLIGNIMRETGILFGGSLEDIVSTYIDETNTVNGVGIKYYRNQIGLELHDFTFRGQILIINCSKLRVTHLNLYDTTKSLSLYYCNDSVIKGVNSFDIGGESIYLFYSRNNSIADNIPILVRGLRETVMAEIEQKRYPAFEILQKFVEFDILDARQLLNELIKKFILNIEGRNGFNKPDGLNITAKKRKVILSEGYITIEINALYIDKPIFIITKVNNTDTGAYYLGIDNLHNNEDTFLDNSGWTAVAWDQTMNVTIQWANTTSDVVKISFNLSIPSFIPLTLIDYNITLYILVYFLGFVEFFFIIRRFKKKYFKYFSMKNNTLPPLFYLR